MCKELRCSSDASTDGLELCPGSFSKHFARLNKAVQRFASARQLGADERGLHESYYYAPKAIDCDREYYFRQSLPFDAVDSCLLQLGGFVSFSKKAPLGTKLKGGEDFST